MNQLLNTEKNELSTKLKKIPLYWAKTARFYYENEYREYWIATIENKTLLISGLDIKFEVISLSYDDALSEKERMLLALGMNGVLTLKNTIISKCEALWVLSVIESTLGQLKP